ncbi:hypothetical protein ACHAWF_015067 [Thalassiosira exigua]
MVTEWRIFQFELRRTSRWQQDQRPHFKVAAKLILRELSAQPQPSREEDPPPLPSLFDRHHSGNDNDNDRSQNNHPLATSARKPQPKIGRLILVRHGQSVWNVTDPTRNLTARFTGWADIGLTQQGKDQAAAAGRAIQSAVRKGILPSKAIAGHASRLIPDIDVVFCSLLKRSTDTMNILLEEIDLAEKSTANVSEEDKGSPKYLYPIPIVQSWRLNERHYGALVGLSKEGAERLYGKVRLTRWRDSWDVPPPPMPLEMVKRWGREEHCQPVTIVKKGDSGRMCVFDPASAGMQSKKIVEHGGKTKRKTKSADEENSTFMPPSESLRDTYERFMPLWINGIAPHLREGRTVLVIGHANTIRSMLFAIDGNIVTRENSKKVKIPSALPLIYEFVDGSGFDPHEEDSATMYGINNPKSEREPNGGHVYGRECSSIVPGNLRVLKPIATGEKSESKDIQYQLNGTWVETDETHSVSFCTELGRRMGEHEIA